MFTEETIPAESGLSVAQTCREAGPDGREGVRRQARREDALRSVAGHFDDRAGTYGQKYATPSARHLFEHEKRRRASLAHAWIREHARDVPQGRRLDVGCGDGRHICQSLTEHGSWTAVGVDVSRAMIDQSYRSAESCGVADRVEWIHGKLDEVRETFQVVTALGVVGYQPNQVTFVERLADRVADNGVLIFSFANALSAPRQIRSLVQGVHRSVSRKYHGVRFRTISVRRLDNCLARKKCFRVGCCWLCFGIGLPHSCREIEFSRWCESRWQASNWARYVAQVGVVCYQRFLL